MNAGSILPRTALAFALICAIPLSAAHAQNKTKLRIATASPSLSYLPIYIAVKKGFFGRRGFDVELIQMNASLTAPALLNRAVDYTTIPSAIATAAARGAPAKVIFFASVKLQHMLSPRPEIVNVSELAGKRIAAAGFGNLTSYEIQFLIERYHLGPQTTIVSASSSTDETIKNKRSEVLEVLKASIEGLEHTSSRREPTIELIGNWMALNSVQAIKAYDSVRETYSQNGIPTEEQAKAYIAMLAATAGVSGNLPSAAIFDFSLASAAAKELAAKK